MLFCRRVGQAVPSAWRLLHGEKESCGDGVIRRKLPDCEASRADTRILHVTKCFPGTARALVATACGREHRCARRRLWGHRNEPALRVAGGGQGCERAWRATRRFCSRRRFAHHLVADSHHLAEIRHPDPARRQSRGRRHRGAARNSQSETCAPANLARCDTRCGTRRRGIALWRWRNHARDFSAQRRRRPQGGCSRIGPGSRSRRRCSS